MVYEDFLTGARIKRAFDRLLSRIGDGADFQLGLCRFDLLRDPELNTRATDEAAAADIVVISTHGQVDPPVEVKSWLCRWFEKREDKPAALVISLDQDGRTTAAGNRLLTGLRSQAAAAGVDLIQHLGGLPAGSDQTGGNNRKPEAVNFAGLPGQHRPDTGEPRASDFDTMQAIPAGVSSQPEH